MRRVVLSLVVGAFGCGGPAYRPAPASPATVGAPPVPGDLQTREAYQTPQDALQATAPREVATGAREIAVPPPRESLDDGKILTIAHVATRLESEQARLAALRASDPRVRELARTILRDARRAEEQTAKLARAGQVAPAPSTVADDLQAEAQASYERLAGTTGASFDRAYIEAQAAAERGVLDLINQRLLPGATDTTVQAVVRSLRPDVERHYRSTTALQEKIDK